MRSCIVLASILSLVLTSGRPPQQETLHIQVREAGNSVPCRITVLDARGQLTEFEIAKGPRLAVRKGVVYTANGSADIGLPAGEYTIYATRGPLYSLAQKKI